ncbi:MAG: uroporphyrinogen decarboxylase family protein [Phycisphaerae bacterium]
MTPREIMKAVLRFEHPPRIGMVLPDPYPHDIVWGSRQRVGWKRTELEPRGNEHARWIDEWGNTWASLTDYDKGEVVQGAITDWSQLEGYRPPDCGRKEDYAKAAEVFAAAGDKFRVGGMFGLTFNVARYIRKLEHYLCDLALEPEKIARLNAMVRQQLLVTIDRLAEAGADAIMFGEDWGTQDRLMISPAMWRAVFRPEFEALCGRAHERGLFVFMHSCGKMTDIIGDLIACGVDLLQFDQPRLHGIELLGRQFGGKVTFWCPVDIQTTLQTRDPNLIREDARLLVEHLGSHGGGFVAGYYEGNQAIGLTPDVQDIACRAFVEFGQMTGK